MITIYSTIYIYIYSIWVCKCEKVTAKSKLFHSKSTGKKFTITFHIIQVKSTSV